MTDMPLSSALFNLPNCLTLAMVMVLIGCYGVFRRQSLIMVLLSVEVILNGVNLTLISFNYFRWGALETSHYLFMLSIGVAAVEAAVGLAMVIVLFKNYGDITRTRIAHLGENSGETLGDKLG
jgi:NADH-quinone oxidoreductase subunit K